MLRNTLNFLKLIVKPRPSFHIPPSRPEPFYYYNTQTTFAGNVSRSPSEASQEQPPLASFLSLSSLGSARQWASRQFSRRYWNSGNASMDTFLSAALSRSDITLDECLKDQLDRSLGLPTASPGLRRRKGSIKSTHSRVSHSSEISSPSEKLAPYQLSGEGALSATQTPEPQNSARPSFEWPSFELSPIIEDSGSFSNLSHSSSICSSFSSSEFSQGGADRPFVARRNSAYSETHLNAVEPAGGSIFFQESPTQPPSSMRRHKLRTSSTENIPSLVLTLPTPELPAIPAFVPKPIDAARRRGVATSTLDVPHGRTADAPSLPACGHCGSPEAVLVYQCRACEKQLPVGGAWQAVCRQVRKDTDVLGLALKPDEANGAETLAQLRSKKPSIRPSRGASLRYFHHEYSEEKDTSFEFREDVASRRNHNPNLRNIKPRLKSVWSNVVKLFRFRHKGSSLPSSVSSSSHYQGPRPAFTDKPGPIEDPPQIKHRFQSSIRLRVPERSRSR